MNSSDPPVAASKSERSSDVVREVVASILVGGVGPYVLYAILRPHMDEVPSLIAGTLLPAGWEIVTFLRHRRFDPVSALNLVALGMGIVLALTGGGARFILVKESFVTGVIGTGFLLSLFCARPAHFYLGRQFVTGNVQARVDRYNAGWDASQTMRTVLRTTTTVWGVVMLLELVLRLVLVFRLTTEQMLVAGPVVFYVITGALILWTVRYVRRHRPEIRAAIRAHD